MSAKDEALRRIDYLRALFEDVRTSRGVMLAQIEEVSKAVEAIVENMRPRRAKKAAAKEGE